MLGYPILSIRSIPQDARVPRSLLQGGARERRDQVARSSSTTCGRRTTRPTARRRCGRAKFAAHHPNVVVLDLSSFKCGHDAPTYGLIDSIIETVEDALRGAPRHRREQAGRLDQDPRQDLRARAEAPRGAPRGRRARSSTSSSTPSTRSASSSSSSRRSSSSDAPRPGSRARRADRGAPREARRRTCRTPAARWSPSPPEGHREARQEDQGRDDRSRQRTGQRCDQRR